MSQSSTNDLWDFASALHIHGADVDKLCSNLPNWTRSDIIGLIRKFKGRAKRERHFIERGRKAFQSTASKKITIKLEDNDKSSNDSTNIRSFIKSSNNVDSALVMWVELLQKIHNLQGTSDKLKFDTRIAKNAPVSNHSQMLSKVSVMQTREYSIE